MNKQQLLQKAKNIVGARRIHALDRCDALLAKLQQNPAWNSCTTQLKQAQIAFAQSHGQDQVACQKIAKLKAQQAEILQKLGVHPSKLQPQFHCKACQDRGFVDGKMCKCLQAEFLQLLGESSNVANKGYTFQASTEQNPKNAIVYKKAQKAMDDGKNLLLLGNTGTGKTYLVCACVNHAVAQGKTALFTTAYSLNSLFLECHIGNAETRQAVMESLMEVDVLAIDDLGTENVYKNVTAEYLFSLVNERMFRGKQTVVSTNLTLQSIRNRYDERLFSRLVDQQKTLVALLVGDDKRIVK